MGRGNAAQVADEEFEPCSTRQAVVRDLDIADEFCSVRFALVHTHTKRVRRSRLLANGIVNKYE